MDRTTLNRYLCVTLTTLDEVDFAPEVSLYLGIGADNWRTVRQVLLAGELATIDESHAVTITAKGRGIAATVRRAMAA
jgi:hypothetical protein